MNIRKKFYIIFIGFFALSFALFYFGKKFMNNAISNFTSGKMDGVGSLMGLSNVPVFKSGVFSDDGNYFAYTYQPEIEKPDVDASVTIRGMGFPTYFQVIETATGKKLTDKQYKTAKSDQMYVVYSGDNWVWLMQSVYHKENQIALYDLKANKFHFDFGELEKLNPSVDWKSTYTFYINNTGEKGLILETILNRLNFILTIQSPNVYGNCHVKKHTTLKESNTSEQDGPINHRILWIPEKII